MGLALAGAACGHPEKSVVDYYFNAVNAKDNQTLSSFATVRFERPVQSWAIKDTLGGDHEPLPPAGLGREGEGGGGGAWPTTPRTPGAYNLDHFADIDEVRDAKSKGRPVPAKLAPVATQWEEFNQKDRDSEEGGRRGQGRRWRRRSATWRSPWAPPEDLEGMQGEVMTKKIVVDVTIEGQSAALRDDAASGTR